MEVQYQLQILFDEMTATYSYEARRAGRLLKRRGGFSSADAAKDAAQREVGREVMEEHVLKPMEKMAKDLDRMFRRTGIGRVTFKRR